MPPPLHGNELRSSVSLPPKPQSGELLNEKRVLERRARDLASVLATVRATLEATTDGILVTDGQGNITDFNQRFLEMWGLPEDLVQRGSEKEIYQITRQQLEEPQVAAARVAEIYALAPDQSNDTLAFRDGRIFERHSKVLCVHDRVVGRVWSFRDVTHEAQSAITARRLAAIVDSSNDAIVGKNLNLIITSWNAAAERIFGYTAAEMIGTSIMRIVPPDRHDEEMMIRSRILRGERVEPMETVRMAKGGRLIEIAVTISPIKDSRGNVIGASKVARDITERKRSERELAESHSLIQAVIENTDDAIFVKDLEGRYKLINPAGARALGRSLEEIIGRKDDEIFPPENAASTIAHDREVIATHTSHTYEDTAEMDGQNRTFLSTKSPHRDGGGELIGIVGISRDITERKRNEEALEIAKNEAEKANRAKSEFLSRMSHELRTPLNAILGFSQLLESSDLSATNLERVGYVQRAGRHLLELINEVLEISRIEAGRLELSLEPVQVMEVLREAADFVRPLAEERGIHLTLSGAENAELYVKADRQRLKQVLLNLVANAVKYNRERGTVHLQSQMQSHDCIRIAVVDSGVGIAEENRDRLFVPFERLGAEQSAVQGTGLGLALTKSFAEAMGGHLGFESKLGEGSTFWIDLPRADQTSSTIKTDDLAPAFQLHLSAPLTLLYIEDNASNLALIEHVVRGQSQLKLISATRGEVGVDLACTQKPDLILLDVHLPDINGDEVLRRLKANEGTREIPVVVLSADATSRQIRRLRDAGACEYLTKPLEVKRFFEVIEEQARHRAAKSAA